MFYTDGSLVDGPTQLLARTGWAFVAVGPDGRSTGADHGTPPPCIRCIDGAEAWALLQAIRSAAPGSQYRTDSESCVLSRQQGRRKATDWHRPLARVFSLKFTAADDTPTDYCVWMSSHCKQ